MQNPGGGCMNEFPSYLILLTNKGRASPALGLAVTTGISFHPYPQPTVAGHTGYLVLRDSLRILLLGSALVGYRIFSPVYPL